MEKVFLEEVKGADWREGSPKLRPVERIDKWPNKGVSQIKVPDEPYSDARGPGHTLHN